MSGGSFHVPATAIAVQEGLDRVHPSTWRFDLARQMRLFSSTDEVCVVFRLILDNSQFSAGRCSIHILEQCSFAYYVLDGDVARISGYLHASVAKGPLPSRRRVQVQRPQPRQMQEQLLHPRQVQAVSCGPDGSATEPCPSASIPSTDLSFICNSVNLCLSLANSFRSALDT